MSTYTLNPNIPEFYSTIISSRLDNTYYDRLLLGAPGRRGARSFACEVCLRRRCSETLRANISRCNIYFSWVDLGDREPDVGNDPGTFDDFSDLPSSSFFSPSAVLSLSAFSFSFSFSFLRLCFSSHSSLSFAISSTLIPILFSLSGSSTRVANPWSDR